MKKFLILLVLAAVIGFLGWKTMRKEAVVEPTTNTATEVTPTSSIEGATLSNGDFKYEKKTDYVTFGATYPSKTGLTAEADAKARLTMENWIKVQENQFAIDTKEMLDDREMARLKETGRWYETGITYKKYSGGNNMISYVYQIYQDTGGAHPNGFFKTITFDTTGNEVTLEGLFKPDARYLDVLSAKSKVLVIAELENRLGQKVDESIEDWVRMGTAPSPEALQFFYLDGTNLVMIFPRYQVAAYAAGDFEARIPLSELSDILR